MDFIDLKTQYNALRNVIGERIQRVLDHGQYILGPEVNELESELSNYCNTKHCITVASGTDALLISLMAIGIRAGDEIITTPFTFVATAEVIVLLGATPVFVDIDPETCNIDVEKIENAINAKTRAIIPVSLYGQPADMDEINSIAERHGIVVVEDAAQSFGSEYKARRSCNLSKVGCTSFFPSKPLGCYGDGGAIFTNDDEIALACREIRVHGQSERYVHTRIGVGGRMDTIQCAVVLAKLQRFGWEVSQRALIGHRYNNLLLDAIESNPEIKKNISLIVQRQDRTSVFAQYTIRVNERHKIQDFLKSEGIPTAIHYPMPLNVQPAYKNICRSLETPVAMRCATEVISLPMCSDLLMDQQAKIVETLIRHLKDM